MGIFITLFVFVPTSKALKNSFVEIDKSNDSLRKLFYSIKEALLIVNKDGIILLMNSDAKNIIVNDKNKKVENIENNIKWVDLDDFK